MCNQLQILEQVLFADYPTSASMSTSPTCARITASSNSPVAGSPVRENATAQRDVIALISLTAVQMLAGAPQKACAITQTPHVTLTTHRARLL